MTDYDKVKLLHSPYRPPMLRKGERTTCLYRDRVVVVTSWSVSRISWPRCRAVESHGGSGLLVDEELARAVRTESAAAVTHWWGVAESTVWLWWKALGVTQWGTEGSARLHARTVRRVVAKTRGKKLSRALVKRREAARRAKGYVAPDRWAEDGWTPGQLALLGTMPDASVARKIGRSVHAVRLKRTRLGIPTVKDRGRRGVPAGRRDRGH